MRVSSRHLKMHYLPLLRSVDPLHSLVHGEWSLVPIREQNARRMSHVFSIVKVRKIRISDEKRIPNTSFFIVRFHDSTGRSKNRRSVTGFV
jgi:hypothetical protein